MYLTRRLIVLAAVLTVGFEPGIPCAAAQGEPRIQQLLRQLQSTQTSDQAAVKLLELGNADASARRFLAVHLPVLIDADPRNRRPDRTTTLRPEWCAAARLAGELRLVEAAPALVKWISYRTSSLMTSSRAEGLATSPAGTALLQIGDAAVPALRQVLKQSESKPNMDVVYALLQINSPRARAVLRDYAPRVQNAEVREFIYNRLETEEHNNRQLE
jgi:hypothetical protein